MCEVFYYWSYQQQYHQTIQSFFPFLDCILQYFYGHLNMIGVSNESLWISIVLGQPGLTLFMWFWYFDLRGSLAYKNNLSIAGSWLIRMIQINLLIVFCIDGQSGIHNQYRLCFGVFSPVAPFKLITIFSFLFSDVSSIFLCTLLQDLYGMDTR